ncbi:leucine-rich repeat protein [Hominifimenecus microfluidus]
MKRRINKIVSLLIVLCMIVTILPVEAEASNADLQKKMINVLYAGAGGRMTCDFDGYVTTSGRHEGIDFARTAGASIYSLISGVVTRVTNASKLSTLAIYDSTNNKTVVYLHGNYSVSVGQTITQGQYIGTESNNGASAAHTHIEVRDGKRTAAAISVGDSTLDNANPYPYWSIIFGNPNPIHTQDSRYNGFVPFKSYPISTGNIAVYTESGSQYSNRYITGSTDLCTINAVYTDGWCQVTYPSSAEASGYFTAYAKLSDFIPSASPSAAVATSGGTAYRRSSGSDTIGSISSGDKCLKVSSANGRIQAIYPVTGQSYSKMGWVAESVFGGSNPGGTTSAAGYKLPCQAYTISSGKVTVYDSSHNAYATSSHYIDGANDLCTINSIGTDGWCQVTYPTSSGSFTAYAPLNTFILGNAGTKEWTASGTYTAYRRSSGTATIGSVSNGDSCVKVASENGKMQVMYPVTGKNYYKLGWIEANDGHNPTGMVDSAGGDIYSVSVSGWAFDDDDTGAALTINVYIGSTKIGTTRADLERTDVHKAYGCGNYHGYAATFNVDRSFAGNQTIRVYAVNVGGGNGDTLLAEKTVTIGSDTTAPVITDCKVSNITSSGYTVTCKVTDNTGVDRVQFPTWTENNGQDDIFPDWVSNTAASGTKSGNTYTYQVHTSAHNYEAGTYITHIYAYDKYGNSSSSKVDAVKIPVEVEDIGLDQSALTFTAIGQTQKLTATIFPEDATNQSITWASSNTSVATVNAGTVKAVGDGTAVITASSGNGLVAECKVTVRTKSAGKLAVETKNAVPGETVRLAIKMNTNPGIIAARLKVTYDANALTLVKAEDGGILGDSVFGNNLSANPYVLLWENGLSKADYTATGDLAYLTFKVADNASEGTYAITVTYDSEEIYDVNMNNVKFTVDNGAVHVEKSAIQQGSCGNNVTWSLGRNGTLSISGSGAMKNYTYKSEMPWYSYINQIQRVEITDGVTSIGDYAFYGMPKLTTIVIADSVKTIGGYAFKNCTALDQVNLPSSLTKLGESAFYGCTSLTSIAIPEGVYTVWAYTFKNCTNLQSVSLPSTLIKLDEAAFYGCSSLKEAVFPDSLSIIGIYCFKNCSSLASVTLPSALTQIREAAFYGTALQNLTIPDGVTVIGKYAFKNCEQMKSVAMPTSLQKIDDSAFYNCNTLTVLNLPNGLTSICDYAFRKCTGLQMVSFPESLRTIGESSFYGCTGLSELMIPEGVTQINGYAFKGCTNVYTVTLPSTLESLGESAFYGCARISQVEIPANVTSLGAYVFSRCSALGTVVFTGNAPAIGSAAFNGVKANVYYPAGNATWTADKQQSYGGQLTWAENTANISVFQEETAMDDSTAVLMPVEESAPASAAETAETESISAEKESSAEEAESDVSETSAAEETSSESVEKNAEIEADTVESAHAEN